jgi:Fe-S oxidoreductase
MAQATYHDPCHLGRRLGCYEPPRQLLQRAVTQLDELTHHHEAATCCGSGGLLPQTDPPLASAIARERLSEQPANLPLISACPACQSHLGRNGSGQVYDLLEVLDEAMR